MTQGVFTDKRLLGALDYIDEKYIAEVTEDYEAFEVSGIYKPNKRTLFRTYRQFVALASCLILLSAAFSMIYYVLPQIGIDIGNWGGNAGAGSENVDNTDYFNYSSRLSVDEVLADVIKNGYFVISDGKCISGAEQWDAFIKSVENGEPYTIRIAYHESYELAASIYSEDSKYLDDFPLICLREVQYNGETFKFISKKHKLDYVFEKEYPYIVSYDSGAQTTYCVSLLTKEELSVTDPSNPFAKACGHGSTISSNTADLCDCVKVIIFFEND